MKFSQRLAAVTGSKLPYPALLMGLGVALVAESVIVTVAATASPAPWLLGTGLGVIVVGILLAHRWWGPARWELVRVTGAQAAPARWVVVTASLGRGLESALTSVRHHATHPDSRLERVYVLHTRDQLGMNARDKLCRRLEDELGLADDQIQRRSLPVAATQDPDQVYTVIEQIYADAVDAVVESEDVILDYTGGPKAFTAAMVLAGAVESRRLQNVRPRELAEDGRPVEGTESDVIEVDLRFRVRALSRNTRGVPA